MANDTGENRFHDVSKSKAALDAAKSYRKFMALLADGWPRNKAFMVAFAGVHLLEIPELKPLPEPDPPFATDSLVAALKTAHKRVALLLEDIESDIDFMQQNPPN